MTALPTGQRGQALALGVSALVLVVLWLAAVAPVLDWYASRSEHLAEQRTLAVRMAAISGTAAALQKQLDDAESAAPAPRALFEGATDAIAAAALQQAMQDIASHAGATVLSAEMLPAEQAGSYRRLGIHVQVSAPWSVLIAMLSDTVQVTPRMLVDDLTVRQTLALGNLETHPMEAGFTVTGFHAGQPAR